MKTIYDTTSFCFGGNHYDRQYIYFSHKLRCYTGISGPEKSRNNISEKISYFFTCVDIPNQLAASGANPPVSSVLGIFKGPVFSPPRVFFCLSSNGSTLTSYTLIKMSVWFVVNNTNFILLARIIFSVDTLNIKRKKISMQRHQKDDGSLFRLRRLQRDFWPREI